MAAGKKNIDLEKRAGFKLRVRWLDSVRKPVDLTGWTAKLQVRSTAGSTVLLEASTVNGYIILSGPSGIIDIDIPESVVSALTFTVAKYDLLLIDPTNKPIRFLEGAATTSDGITVR